MKLSKALALALMLGASAPALAANVTTAGSLTALRAIPAGVAAQYNSVSTGITSGVTCVFYWDASSAAADNGWNVIRPTDSTGNGRWICGGKAVSGEGSSGFNAAGYLGIGGDPAQYNVASEPPVGLNVISTPTSKKYFTVTSYGTSNEAAIHSHVARGTQASPTGPLAGDNIFSIGVRAYDPVTHTFEGSSLALQGVLDEDSAGINAYPAAHWQIETAKAGDGARGVAAWFNADHSMTVQKLGIGTFTPTEIIELQNNANSSFNILNRNISAGVTAQAQVQLGNATSANRTQLVQYGTGYTTSGPSIQDGTLLAANGAGGLTLYGAAAAPMNFYTNNTKKAVLSSGGAWQWTAYGAGTITADASGNLTSVSDARMKKDFEAYRPGLDAIFQVAPLSYRWKPESGMETSGRYGGFTAQSIVPYAPLAARLGKDGFYSLDDRALIATLWNGERQLLLLLGLTWAGMIGLGALLWRKK